MMSWLLFHLVHLHIDIDCALFYFVVTSFVVVVIPYQFIYACDLSPVHTGDLSPVHTGDKVVFNMVDFVASRLLSKPAISRLLPYTFNFVVSVYTVMDYVMPRRSTVGGALEMFSFSLPLPLRGQSNTVDRVLNSTLSPV